MAFLLFPFLHQILTFSFCSTCFSTWNVFIVYVIKTNQYKQQYRTSDGFFGWITGRGSSGSAGSGALGSCIQTKWKWQFKQSIPIAISNVSQVLFQSLNVHLFLIQDLLEMVHFLRNCISSTYPIAERNQARFSFQLSVLHSERAFDLNDFKNILIFGKWQPNQMKPKYTFVIILPNFQVLSHKCQW